MITTEEAEKKEAQLTIRTVEIHAVPARREIDLSSLSIGTVVFKEGVALSPGGVVCVDAGVLQERERRSALSRRDKTETG